MSDEWSSNANEAVSLELVEAGTSGLRSTHRFHPKFTYPIFGEEERIFGYDGLDINFRFAAHDLRPNVTISYEKRFAAVADSAALDIQNALKDFIPPSAFAKAADFENTIQDDSSARDFTPPGKFVRAYSRKGKTYEIWSGSLLDSQVRSTVDRMQIFISFFIEAGTPLNTTDADWTLDRWTVYFVFETSFKSPAPNLARYSFIGYATTYRFYTFRPRYQEKLQTQSGKNISEIVLPFKDEISAAALPSRLRISQFLILPPYQSSGHGSTLYNAIYSDALADSTIQELTVEDPSEEFDVLRDINDWKILEPKFDAASIRINTAPFDSSQIRRTIPLPTTRLLPIETLRSIRSSLKVAPRQFARQLEMYLLSRVPFSHRAAGGANLTKLLLQKSKTSDPNDKFYYWWRLILKQRIFKKNRDVLLQLEGNEKHARLDEAARAQEDEYEKLLLFFATSKAKEMQKNGDGGLTGEPVVRDRKRKIIIDEDEDKDIGTLQLQPDAKAAKTS